MMDEFKEILSQYLSTEQLEKVLELDKQRRAKYVTGIVKDVTGAGDDLSALPKEDIRARFIHEMNQTPRGHTGSNQRAKIRGRYAQWLQGEDLSYGGLIWKVKT